MYVIICVPTLQEYTQYTKTSKWHKVFDKLLKKHSQLCPVSYTYIRGLELVDDGSFAAVVQSQTQNVDLFLPQAEPAWQFIQQPHYTIKKLIHHPIDSLTRGN